MVTLRKFLPLSWLLMLLYCGCVNDLEISIRREKLSGKMYQFTAEVPEDPTGLTCSWKIDSTILPSTSSSVTYVFPYEGYHKISVYAKAGKHTGSAEYSESTCKTEFPLNINPQSWFSIDLDSNLFALQGENFTVNWGDGFQDNSLQHTYADSGSYPIEVDWYSSKCKSQIVASGSFKNDSVATASFTFKRMGTTLDFISHPGTLYMVHWDFGDGEDSEDSIPRHVYRAPGTYTVTLTISPRVGISNTETHTQSVVVPATPSEFLHPYSRECSCNVNGVLIKAPLYEYYSNPGQILWRVQADSLPIFDRPNEEGIDILSSAPTICWTQPESHRDRFTVALITRDRPTWENGEIFGMQEGDWIWTSGMATGGRRGCVKFEQGRTITPFSSGGTRPPYDESKAPTALQGNLPYYWTVYSFDEHGQHVEACSLIHPFRVSQ